MVAAILPLEKFHFNTKLLNQKNLSLFHTLHITSWISLLDHFYMRIFAITMQNVPNRIQLF